MKVQYIDAESVSEKHTLKVFLGDRILVSRKPPTSDLLERIRMQVSSARSLPSLLVVLPFENVSTHHALIEFCTEKCILRDLESTNGTTLNSNACEPFVEYELKDWDILSFAGNEFSVEIVAPFSDMTCQSDGVGLSTVNKEMTKWIEAELKIDRQMWSSQGPYLCGTCREEVLPSDRACRKCLEQMHPQPSLKPNLDIEFGLHLIKAGIRWDRCLHDALITSTATSVFVEMQAVHDRDLPEKELEGAACQMLHLRHAGLFRLFAWFDRPAPGWKYDKYHVRVFEHSDAVSLASVARNGAMACATAAEIVLAATNTALYALENNCQQFADCLDISQIWLVPSSSGGYGVKLDCHRQSLFSWKGSWYAEVVQKPLFSAAGLITAARFKGEQRKEHTRVLSAAIILYRLIVGQMPQFPEIGFELEPWKGWCIQDLPNGAEITEPIADLILSCLGGDTERMPANLKEFAKRLSSASIVD